MFSLEALKAGHGDALVLHYGSADNPQMILIDGGPAHTFNETLLPRLVEMTQLRGQRPLSARLAMVSHIDNDHIIGITDLFTNLTNNPDPIIDIAGLWHNSFHESIGAAADALVANLGAAPPAVTAGLGISTYTKGIAAGLVAGKKLSRQARSLAIGTNQGGALNQFIAEGDVFDVDDECELIVLNPDRAELRGLRAKWEQGIAGLGGLSDDDKQLIVASIVEKSLANISSLVVLATRRGKTILLTGDARGNSIIAGMRKAGKLVNDKAHVDILKLPHHGSDKNVDTDFFRTITADHYIFSGDRTLGNNPDRATFQMLTEARGDAPYAIHFNHFKDEFQEWYDADIDINPARDYEVFFPGDGATGLWIDLEEDEPLWF